MIKLKQGCQIIQSDWCLKRRGNAYTERYQGCVKRGGTLWRHNEKTASEREGSEETDSAELYFLELWENFWYLSHPVYDMAVLTN
jgi:hypothetical protein